MAEAEAALAEGRLGGGAPASGRLMLDKMPLSVLDANGNPLLEPRQISPQGIVHGTFNTILNAGRKFLGVPDHGDLSGITFVSSGLGGMSGAQPKAATIAGAVGIFAEVDMSRIETRKNQGWVDIVLTDLSEVFKLAEEKAKTKERISIAYWGNIVDLLEAAVAIDFKIDLLSDQTSCHNAYNGGYCPVGLTFQKRTDMLRKDRELFCQMVDHSLRRHFDAIQTLTGRGTYFFDYGNSFMKAVYDAGASEVVVLHAHGDAASNPESIVTGLLLPAAPPTQGDGARPVRGG